LARLGEASRRFPAINPANRILIAGRCSTRGWCGLESRYVAAIDCITGQAEPRPWGVCQSGASGRAWRERPRFVGDEVLADLHQLGLPWQPVQSRTLLRWRRPRRRSPPGSGCLSTATSSTWPGSLEARTVRPTQTSSQALIAPRIAVERRGLDVPVLRAGSDRQTPIAWSVSRTGTWMLARSFTTSNLPGCSQRDRCLA